MTWNYRVMEFIDVDGEPWHEIREVYYTEGNPTAYTEHAANVSSENVDGLKWLLERMHEALDKPVLREADFRIPFEGATTAAADEMKANRSGMIDQATFSEMQKRGRR